MWTSLPIEAVCELRKTLRMRVFALMALGFPLVFYLMFGVALAGSRTMGGRSFAAPMLGTYGAFGVIGAALFTFGVNVAVERAQGWLLLKRATPMPPVVYVLGKVLASLVFCAVIAITLGACAALLGHVHLTPVRWIAFATALIAGSIPFCALGLAIGFSAGPNSAPGIVNLVHLPAAFASGLWMPFSLLPGSIQAIAPWLPQYHLGQLALSAVGQADTTRLWVHIIALLAWTLAGIALAVLAFRRDEGKLYG